MIEPTKADIGRKVIYTGNRYPGGQLEEGVITSFNERTVFVRYGTKLASQGTNPADLEWGRALATVYASRVTSSLDAALAFAESQGLRAFDVLSWAMCMPDPDASPLNMPTPLTLLPRRVLIATLRALKTKEPRDGG